MVNPPPPLDVQVKFPTHSPPIDASITIRFVEADHAKRYYDYLVQTQDSFHQQYRLNAQQRDKSVTLRLPLRFTGISASVRCNGFFFTVSERYRDFLRDWVRTLKLWSFLGQSSTEVFVIRDWFNYSEIVAILDPHRDQHKGKEAEFAPIGRVNRAYE